MRQRWYAWLFAVGLTGLSLEPAFRDPPEDGYPFSNYPMFSYPRPQEPWISTALGVKANGETMFLEPRLIASREPMQAVATLNRSLRGGRAARDAQCKQVAGRIAEAGSPWSDVIRVRLERRQYGLYSYFEGQTEPKATTKMAECLVERAGQ